MSQIVSWGYYSSLFSKVSEEEFPKAATLAEKEVQAVIGPIRWVLIKPDIFGFDQLKDCICKTIDKMAENEFLSERKGISSASNDGYSESYVVQTDEQMRTELRSAIRTWLSGTGLVGAY